MAKEPEISPDAARRADELAAAIEQEGGSLSPAFKAFEEGLEEIKQAGLPVEAIVPAGEHGLGFAIKKAKDGKSFWETYRDVVRKKLCTPNSKLRKLADSGASIGASSLVGLVMGALGLPIVALSIASGIAAIIATSGIDAFCEYTKPANVPRRRS